MFGGNPGGFRRYEEVAVRFVASSVRDMWKKKAITFFKLFLKNFKSYNFFIITFSYAGVDARVGVLSSKTLSSKVLSSKEHWMSR